MKTKTVRLGSLGLMEEFRIPGEKTVYRTITYAPSRVNLSIGDRWCLNMTTLKAVWFHCCRNVSTWKQMIEISEESENK
jgi:hypothetical protein